MSSPSSSAVPCLSPPLLLPSPSSASPSNKEDDCSMEISKNTPVENDNMKMGSNIFVGEGKRKRCKAKTPEITIEKNSGAWLKSGNFCTDTALEEFEGMILHFFTHKGNFLNLYTKEMAYELLKKLSLEIVKISAKSIEHIEKSNNNLEKILVLEERATALMAQTINLQSSGEGVPLPATSITSSYLDAARKGATTVSQRMVIPPPSLPNELKHSPAERVILVKAEEKGKTNTKEQQEKFRGLIKDTIGKHNEVEVSAIRPTKHGGYLIITRSEQARDNILMKIRNSGLIHESRLTAPAKKFVKMICRDAPAEICKNKVLNDFYSKHNPQLAAVPTTARRVTIYITKLGWIFELSSAEAAAIEAQGGKVRHGFGCELRLEEHIPLQQCYRCCRYGHNAFDCTGNDDICRLCAIKGHCGRECPQKNERNRWRCFNCMEANRNRGLNLNINHAAAQMHKCAIAEHEKDVRRSQLAAAGIYTAKKMKWNTALHNTNAGVSMSRGQANARTETETNNKHISMKVNTNGNKNHVYGENTFFKSFTPSSSATTNSSSSSSLRNHGNIKNPHHPLQQT